jgi:hypothetical protein
VGGDSSVGIVAGCGLDIMTELSRPGELSGYSEWPRAGDYDSSMREVIAQWL